MNAVFNWGLIYKENWGISGSPWATNFTRTAELIMICLFMMTKRKSVLEQTWPMMSFENLSSDQISPFLHIALPGALAFLGKSICSHESLCQSVQCTEQYLLLSSRRLL